MPHYNSNHSNTFSQNGEDGIIKVLFEELNVDLTSLHICEYGATDGIHCSNSRKWLIENNAKCILIESGAYGSDIFDNLLNNTKEYNAICVNGKVGNPESDSECIRLDDILSEYNFPEDFDLLSVDIDGKDHESVYTVGKYKPKIIIIEINSGKDISNRDLPLNISDTDGGMNFGSSITWMNKLGYDVVCHTGNMIYVRET